MSTGISNSMFPHVVPSSPPSLLPPASPTSITISKVSLVLWALWFLLLSCHPILLVTRFCWFLLCMYFSNQPSPLFTLCCNLSSDSLHFSHGLRQNSLALWAIPVQSVFHAADRITLLACILNHIPCCSKFFSVSRIPNLLSTGRFWIPHIQAQNNTQFLTLKESPSPSKAKNLDKRKWKRPWHMKFCPWFIISVFPCHLTKLETELTSWACKLPPRAPRLEAPMFGLMTC